jgi:HEPN domain-containing protein
LIEHDVPLEKTHDLIKLHGKILKINDLRLNDRKLAHISEVYTETRYPEGIGLLPDGLPSDEEAREFIEYAKEIQTIILAELRNGAENITGERGINEKGQYPNSIKENN